MLAEVKCVVFATWLSTPVSREAGKCSALRNTWEGKYSVVLLMIFKPERISTWRVFGKERSGDRKMKEI